jgi:FixJ family two-component response regulator
MRRALRNDDGDCAMPTAPTRVYIVDDEPSICTAYARLVRSAKMQPQTFASVEEFLQSDFSDENACVVSDIQMPGTSGLELPGLLAAAGRHVPVVFVTAHDTSETRDRAQSVGAAAYFRKPVDDQALLDAIAWAVNRQHPT